MTERYRSDYPTKKIGGGNPYYACAACGRADPQINGRLEGHLSTCEWRIKQDLSALGHDGLNKLLKIQIIALNLKVRCAQSGNKDQEALVDQILSITGAQ